jgi:hypothetical protein
LSTQLACARVGSSYLRGGIAFCDIQGVAKGELEVHLVLDALGSVGQGFEQLQPSDEQLGCFLMGRAPHSVLSRLLQILHRLVVVPSLLKMHGQFSGDLACLLAIGGFRSLADALMQPLSPSRWDTLVEDFLIQGVEETVPRRDSAIRPVRCATRPQKMCLPC